MLNTLVQTLNALCVRFTESERGAVAIIFAMALPVIALAGGAGIDMARVNSASVKVQAALDSAVIAATKELTKGAIDESDVQDVAEGFFNGNIQGMFDQEGLYRVENLRFELNSSEKKIVGALDLYLQTTFLRVGGFEELQIDLASTGVYNPVTVELSLVLDVTGSMRGRKLRDLQAAANELVDQLLGEQGSLLQDRVRISLVPYSNGVNVGNSTGAQRDRLEAITGNGDGSPCVVERRNRGGRYAFTEDPPVLASGPVSNNPTLFPTGPSSCPSTEVIWLTSDARKLKNQINALRARGGTAGHLGIGWGWYTLSPEWGGSSAVSPDLKNLLPSGSAPADYTDDPTGREIEKNEALKVMVIMTDGQFNTRYQRGNGSSEQQARRLCGSIADTNVRVYSVAFRAPGRAERLLKDCVANEGRYFDASTGNELIDAFRQIAEEIARLRLSA